MIGKKYSSGRKLDSLPVGSTIRFGDEYSAVWVKEEKGWGEQGVSLPFRWDAKTVLAYNGNRKYTIRSIGKGEN